MKRCRAFVEPADQPVKWTPLSVAVDAGAVSCAREGGDRRKSRKSAASIVRDDTIFPPRKRTGLSADRGQEEIASNPEFAGDVG
jgi:hypothetical protein